MARADDGREREEMFVAVGDERRRLAVLLQGLREEQWLAPSLCAGWTVQDVVGHLTAGWEMSWSKMAVLVVRAKGSFDRANRELAHELASRGPAALVESLLANADHRFTPPVLGPEAPLTDVIVHGQDIALALGLDHRIVSDRLRVVADVAFDPVAQRARVVPKRRVESLSFAATDAQWRAGSGDEVIGPLQDLTMALHGRAVTLAALDGPGLPEFTARIRRSQPN